MKSQLSLIFATLVVLLGSMIWMVTSRSTIATAPSLSAAPAAVAFQSEPSVPQTVARTVEPAAVAAASTIAPAANIAPVADETPAPRSKPAPMVNINGSGEVRYIARNGDTVSQLAIALLGSDSKEHRDAVIVANPSLQSDPDRVLEGRSYSIASPSAQTSNINGDDEQSREARSIAAVPKLRYIARPGDSVGALAAHLLGGDTKQNRDAIIAQNASLKDDPDHLVAGQTYTIAAPDGLTVDRDAPHAAAPTTQPDADEAAKLSVGRTLRYTAQVGDSVSKLATVLLGSDTPANRELIIKSNPSLKEDPDHLVAGQSYWIAAPIADSTR